MKLVKHIGKFVMLPLIAMSAVSCQNSGTENQAADPVKEGVFPFALPTEKPNIPLSASSERMFDYESARAQDNELFTQFKYTRLKGFDYNGGDGTISRRDPSRPILVDGS